MSIEGGDELQDHHETHETHEKKKKEEKGERVKGRGKEGNGGKEKERVVCLRHGRDKITCDQQTWLWPQIAEQLRCPAVLRQPKGEFS